MNSNGYTAFSSTSPQPRRNLASELEKGMVWGLFRTPYLFTNNIQQRKIQLRRRMFSLRAARLKRSFRTTFSGSNSPAF